MEPGPLAFKCSKCCDRGSFLEGEVLGDASAWKLLRVS